MQSVEFLLRKGLSRVTCVRARVAAVALMQIEGEWTPISLGWNHEVLERGGLDCAEGCPRARAGEIRPGVSDYDSGASRCIALHAEEHALRGLQAYEGFSGEWSEVVMVTTRVPCYKCATRLELLGVRWVQVDMDSPGLAEEMLSSCPEIFGRA